MKSNIRFGLLLLLLILFIARFARADSATWNPTTSPGNNLQVSYSGGDGNDLTLTVVP